MLIISGRQYTLTKRFYVWFAIVLLLLGVGSGALFTMVAPLKRTQRWTAKDRDEREAA